MIDHKLEQIATSKSNITHISVPRQWEACVGKGKENVSKYNLLFRKGKEAAVHLPINLINSLLLDASLPRFLCRTKCI